jgi:hypothetical protein
MVNGYSNDDDDDLHNGVNGNSDDEIDTEL